MNVIWRGASVGNALVDQIVGQIVNHIVGQIAD